MCASPSTVWVREMNPSRGVSLKDMKATPSRARSFHVGAPVVDLWSIWRSSGELGGRGCLPTSDKRAMAKKNAAKKDADADKEPVKKDVDETTEDADEE